MAEPLSRDELWKLLQISIDEEYTYIKENQNRTALYAGFVMTILGASVAGALQAKAGAHWLALLAGPVVATGVAAIAIESARRFYQRFLEALSVRAKVEADLGLGSAPPDAVAAARPYWKDKPYTAPRWLGGRLDSRWEDSPGSAPQTDGVQRWVNSLMAGGEQKQVRLLFRFLQVISALMAVLFVVMCFCEKFLP